MNSFQIKAFKDWQSREGGGYQFNLYLDNKKFAWVHNDGNGGMIDIDFTDPKNQAIWDAHIKSLGQWKTKFGAINGTEFFDHTSETAIDKLVEDYEMEKHRKKGTLFRLKDDTGSSFRTLNVKDIEQAKQWLTKEYTADGFTLI